MEYEEILENVEYKRDIHHHYMIIEDAKGIDTASYEIRMLLANQIEGLLPCLIQQMDGKMYYYFEITSGEDLHTVFTGKKFQYKELMLLFQSMIALLKRLQAFLLDAGHLVLDLRYIYLREENDYLFCYLPGYQRGLQDSFRDLAEYLLPKIDHQDRDAVSLGYGVYRCSMEAHMTLEMLEEEIYKSEQNSAPEAQEEMVFDERIPQEHWQDEQERKEALRSLFEEEWEEESVWSRIKSWWKQKREGHSRIIKKRQGYEVPEWMHQDLESDETMCLIHSHEKVPVSNKRLCSQKPGKYADFGLHKELTFVGKAAANVDVTLDSAAVSRLHARILQRGNKVYLVDMHSKNGTWVNGNLLSPDQEYELQDQDEVKFADVVYTCSFMGNA